METLKKLSPENKNKVFSVLKTVKSKFEMMSNSVGFISFPKKELEEKMTFSEITETIQYLIGQGILTDESELAVDKPTELAYKAFPDLGGVKEQEFKFGIVNALYQNVFVNVKNQEKFDSWLDFLEQYFTKQAGRTANNIQVRYEEKSGIGFLIIEKNQVSLGNTSDKPSLLCRALLTGGFGLYVTVSSVLETINTKDNSLYHNPAASKSSQEEKIRNLLKEIQRPINTKYDLVKLPYTLGVNFSFENNNHLVKAILTNRRDRGKD